jgi:uncharacterized membrane protein HdeD (DUF308 family)
MDDDLEAVHGLWWIGVVQGAIAIFFGLAAIFWPGLTVLLTLFSAYLIIIGLAEIINGLVNIGRLSTWWMLVLLGFISLGVGVYLIRNPDVTLQSFIIIVGLVLIARGIIDAIRTFTDAAAKQHKALSIVVAALAIVAGILVLAQPVAGGIAFVWILGLYALFYGVMSIAISYGIRDMLKPMPKGRKT